MVLRRVGVLSCGKVLGVMYLVIGVIAAFFMAVFAMAGGDADNPEAGAALVAFLIFVPAAYAIGGFLGGLLMAVLYNFIASVVGGFELEFDQVPATPLTP